MSKIREGYKETEIGIIPKDWEVTKLIDVVDKNDRYSFTGGPFGSDLKSSDYVETGVRVIQLQNIGDGCFNNNSKIYTTEAKADQLNSCNIYPNEIILAKMAEPVARACKIPEYYKRFLMCSDGIRVKVDSTKFDVNFCLYSINSNYFRKQAIKNSTGSTRLRIGLTALKSIPIIHPKLEEQQQIAEILSTTNEHIEKLDKIIEDYELLKKGMIQKLLTEGIGHTEFKDSEIGRIPKEWKVKSLGEISNYRRGSFPQPYGNPEWYDDENGYPFVQVYDVDDNFNLKQTTKRKISSLATNMSVFAKQGTVLVTLQGSIGKTAITQYDAYVDRTLLLFTEFKVEFDKHYFMYVIDALFNVEKKKADGGVIKTITKESLTKFLIPIPSIEEQHEIAEILENINNPLSILLQELEDFKLLKKALMEKLLTGKIRANTF